MTRNFLSRTFFLAMIVATTLNAENVHSYFKGAQKIYSKDRVKLSYYRASALDSDAETVILEGSETANFSKLPFTKFKRKYLNGTYPSRSNMGFIVEKGSYYINFTGTFQGLPTSPHTLQIAIQVGSKLYNLSTSIIDSEYDPVRTITTSQLFHFDKREKISIVARNLTPERRILVKQRTMSIVKVS